MSILQEFKEFAVKGNVVDMSVGIIVGAAFNKIVSSLVADVVMPPIGVLVGGVNFTDLTLKIKEATADAPAVTLKYGIFIQTIVDFTIIVFAIFLVIKLINKLKRAETAAPTPVPGPSKEELLLTEIRDLLKNKS